MATRKAQRAWDQENTVLIAAKLNRRTDADIIAALDEMEGPTASRVKALIRRGIAADDVVLRILQEETQRRLAEEA